MAGKRKKRSSPVIRCVDLFAGAGGFSLAAINQGIKVVAAVEMKPAASETYRLNISEKFGTTLYESDIAGVDPGAMAMAHFTARRFFGSSSEVRKELLPEVQATREKERADEARRKVRSRKRREFRKRLVDSQVPMAHLRDQLETIAEAARLGELPSDEQELTQLRDQLQDHQDVFHEIAEDLGSLVVDQPFLTGLVLQIWVI